MMWTVLTSAITALWIGVASGPTWQPIGQTDGVSLNDGTITLNVLQDVTAGVVSSPITLPGGCNAVMVSAEIGGADAKAVTVAAHDVATGEPIGYWQNPTALDEPMVESIVLDLIRPARRIRLFIGTDSRASSATIGAIEITPLRRTGRYRSMQYGALISDQESSGQTFTARGRRFGGLTLRARVNGSAGIVPRDLHARLYEWKGHPASSRATEPLAEVIVSGTLLPVGSRSVERDLMLPLDASVRPGQTYYVEVLQVVGDEGAGEASPCVIFGGPDGLAGAEMYRGDRKVGWDMNTTLYERQ